MSSYEASELQQFVSATGGSGAHPGAGLNLSKAYLLVFEMSLLEKRMLSFTIVGAKLYVLHACEQPRTICFRPKKESRLRQQRREIRRLNMEKKRLLRAISKSKNEGMQLRMEVCVCPVHRI